MSRESLEQFYQQVLQEPSLQEPLRTAPDRDSLVRLAVELGEQNGYSFTAEEVEAAIEEVRQQPEISTDVDLGNLPETLQYS
ncbi:MAG TPA: Nif11-like leader peptide family natural product precursor [Coleofasciculaceae cyanobacterium]